MINSPEANEDDEKMEQQITAFIGQLDSVIALPDQTIIQVAGEDLRTIARNIKIEAETLREGFTGLLPENAAASLLALQNRMGIEAVNVFNILAEDQTIFLTEGSDDWNTIQKQIDIIYEAMKTVPGFKN